MCRCRMHRDTEHRGRDMHATAALVQAVRSQENDISGPPKGGPSHAQHCTRVHSGLLVVQISVKAKAPRAGYQHLGV